MGKQKYTAKEKKVSRMTRNGLVEENLATKETRKVTNSDQELPYKQKDVEQAFITSEKKKNSHKKAEKKQFSEKVQEGNPAKKEEAANSPPGKRKTQGRYRYRDKPAGVSVDSAVEIRERKEKHRSQYQRQKKKQQRLQFGKLETDGSLKKEKKTSAETDGGHFQAEKNDVSTNRKKGKQKYSRKTIKTYQEVDKAARKQEAERQNKIPKDSVYTKKTNEEQKAKVKYHLYFDKKTGKTDGKKKTLSSVPKKALKNAVYQKAGEDEEENSAVDAAHKLVRSGEWILQEHSSRNIRKNRSQIHKENRLEKRAWKSASRYQYQKYLEEHPEMQKKLIRKLIQKQRIKREYQMAYRAGKIAKETKDTSIRSVNLATKIARKAQEVFVRNVTTLISMGLLLILLLSVMTGFASCSAMFSNGISTVIASSYIADSDEIEKAELYYTQLEASLQQKINQMEARYPGKDEYRYNIGEIGHDPHTLISYLTARYGDFKFDEIKGELETIFSLQYGITVEEKSETRQETSTIQVGQSLGNVVTSGYCNCPICCGVWSGGPTASGAMPQANHTLAVDAANPFLPMGTKVVMNGIEYTVEDTGNFAQYGVQFDVYYDNHAVAEAHGHQTWECFLAEGNQNSVEVTRTVTADVLNVSVQAKPLRSVILSRMEEDEQEIYEEVYSNRGNLQTYKTPVELNWYAYISTYYGYSVNNGTGQTQLHRGVTVNVRQGTEVKSAMNGFVVDVGYSGTFGNYVVTQDKKGVQIKYAYLQSISVANGQEVTTDTVIGTTGSTGSATGSQLYLELVKDSDGKEVEKWTSVKGKAHVIKRLHVGKTYTLREEFAPYGYLQAEEVKFTVSDTAEVQKVEMKDAVPVGRIIINKKGEFVKEVTWKDMLAGGMDAAFGYVTGSLKDVTFEIYAAEDIKAADGESSDYYKKDELVATITTDALGYARSEDLPLGKYYVKEKEAADGYVLDGEIREVDLTYRDQNTPVVTYDEDWQNNRQKAKVTVVKKEKNTDRVLEGGVFALYTKNDILNAEGEVIMKADTMIEQKATDQDGRIVFTADLPINGSYYVKEVQAPAGFVTTEEIKEFDFTYAREDVAEVSFEFTYEDEPTTFEITKSDLTTGEELPGAKLKVSDPEGNVVDEWTSGSTPHIIKELEVGKKYTLTETIPADGYATAESITFVVENTADIQKVEMQDDTTKILISKVDMTDGSSEVKGAKLYILNENQEVMESWTSGDQPHYVEKLPIGTYTLLEETAPKGYIVANKVTFEVKDTGDVQGAKMEDEQAMGKVILNKTDKDTKKPMKGVEFALCDSKGKVLETLVTDSAGHAESKNYPIATFKNGQYKKAITYILKETKTLDGYQLDETEHKIQFEYVNDRTPVIEYTLDLTNKKAPEKDTPETSENQGVSTPGSHGSDATSVSNSPKTGDNTNIAIFVLTLAVSAGCLGTVVAVKRKRK